MAHKQWFHDNTVPLLEGFIAATEAAIAVADATRDDLPLLYVNEAFERLTGYAGRDIEGRNCRFLQGPRTDPAAVAVLREGLAAGRHVSATLLNYRRDGSTFWNRVEIAPVQDPDGRVVQFFSMQRDVTADMVSGEHLAAAERRYRGLLEHLPLVSYEAEVVDGHLRLTYVSPQIEAMTGHPPERWLAEQGLWGSLLHPDDLERIFEAQRRRVHDGRPLDIEYRLVCAGGREIWVWDRDTLPGETGGAGRRTFRGALVDVTHRRRVEAALAHQTLHDPLLGLPNRTLLIDRLAHALAQPRDGPLALLVCDVDDFGVVNDTLGHRGGDEVLRALVPRLGAALGPADTLARLGGDELGVLCDGLERPEDALDLAQRLRAAFREPIPHEAGEQRVSASIGVALAAGGQEDAEALLRDADAAMREAKARGRDRVAVFDPGLRERLAERLGLERDLRRALERGQLWVAYQPIVDLRDERVSAVEALVRWEHPTRGEIPPGAFVPGAERSGLISAIGRWVLERACAQLCRWRDELAGAEDLRVRVNVSGRQVAEEGFSEEVAAVMAAGGLPASALGLELTETVLMAGTGEPMEVLRRLDGLGVELLLDDFGTGYSSLSYLHRFPIDGLKVDRSFVLRLEEDEASRSIVAATIRMAEALDLSVVAEGVETPGQLEVLRDLGCPQAQGFLFGRPAPPEQLVSLLPA